MHKLYIGSSGFHYDHWKGNFYPDDMTKRGWLDYYSKKISTVELNETFYNLPDKETFTKWHKETPPGFIFSVKGSKFITHTKKLKASLEPVDVFFSRVLALREKLGVILWQLPAGLKPDPARLADFLALIKPYGVKSTFEFSEEAWISKKIISLLEKENAALCMSDAPEFLNDLPVTADFVYIKRYGITGRPDTCYNTEQLKADALRIKKYTKQNKDVYVYFNNDASGYAPKNALELIKILKR